MGSPFLYMLRNVCNVTFLRVFVPGSGEEYELYRIWEAESGEDEERRWEGVRESRRRRRRHCWRRRGVVRSALELRRDGMVETVCESGRRAEAGAAMAGMDIRLRGAARK